MKKFVVRCGAMRNLGIVEVDSDASQGFFHGVKAIVQTSRGLEAATILCETTDEKIAQIPNLVPESIAFVRLTTADDEATLKRIQTNEKDEFARCLKTVRRMKIELTLVRVERIFGGERLVVYYVADGRVDFRELVRALAAEFQTRIEMKQIGVRDETKLLADVGDCGREVCCNTYLAAMPPVSMKMAKLQKATLDPTKVSGRCGRLKCCLRYEYELYNELQSEAPPLGKTVKTPNGRGKVVAQELFARRVVVETEDGGRQSFSLDEIDANGFGNCKRRRRDVGENEAENTSDSEHCKNCDENCEHCEHCKNCEHRDENGERLTSPTDQENGTDSKRAPKTDKPRNDDFSKKTYFSKKKRRPNGGESSANDVD